MMNRLADLALVLAMVVIAVVAVTPLGRPGEQNLAARPPGERAQNAPPADHADRPPAGTDRTDLQPWEPDLDRPFPRLPRNVAALEFTPELIDRCIAVADEIDKELAQRLREMRGREPKRLEQLLVRRGHRLLDLAELKERDPALYELKLIELNLDSQISQTAAQLQAARAKDDQLQIEMLEDNLRTYLRLQLASALRAREDYICRFREHLEQLEERLEYDRENFDAIIEMRFHQLIEGEPIEVISTREIHQPARRDSSAARPQDR